MNLTRQAKITRRTKETEISLELSLEGRGECAITTGVGFFDHMLMQLGYHSAMDLKIVAKGDLHIDDHHLVEDVGIVLGQALNQALGDKKGIRRFADIHLPMDDALARVALDISGRPYLYFKADFLQEKVGTFDTELVQEFFQALAIHAAFTLHIEILYGKNTHHMIESCFKAFAHVLKESIVQESSGRLPSTKGRIGG